MKLFICYTPTVRSSIQISVYASKPKPQGKKVTR